MAVFRSGRSGLLLPGTPRPADSRDVVVPDGLIRYWPLDADTLKSSIIQGDLIGGDDGIINGSVAMSSAGQIGTCYSFPGGSSSYIETAVNAGLVLGNAFTLSLWAKATQSQAGAMLLGTAVDNGSFDGIWFAWSLSSAADRTVCMIIDGSTNTIKKTADNAKAINVWHHLLFVYDGSNAASGITIWENGEAVPQTPTGSTIPAAFTNRPWRIGNDRSPADTGFIGFIDDVRVYERLLSPAAIRSIYVSGLQGSRDQAALNIQFSGWPDDAVLPAVAPPDAQILMPAIQL